MKRVTIMVGCPGSGKSTKIKEFADPKTIVSADHYYIGEDGVYRWDGSKIGNAHGQCKARFMDALKRGDEHIICDNTNTTKKEREFYIEEAKDYGYEVFLCVLGYTAPEICAARNVHNVPLDSIIKMSNRIDTPTGYYQV